jgi:hypothetical protein
MFSSVKSSKTNKSELYAQLESDEQTDVTDFLNWLPSQGLKPNTINSYKTYICKSMLKFSGKLEGDLTSDEKSAVKKFTVWHGLHRAED